MSEQQTPEELQKQLQEMICQRDHQGSVDAVRVGDDIWVNGSLMRVDKMCFTSGGIVFHWRRVA